MSKRPWMPLYVADYLADTLDLEADEHGVYLTLLMLTWRRPDASLPNDMEWLKRSLKSCLANFHGHQFNRIVPRLLERFFTLDGDVYRNKRLTNERQKTDKLSANQSQSAHKRWAKTKENKGLPDASAMPSHSHTHSQSQEGKKEDAADAAPTGGLLRLRKKQRSSFPEGFDLSEERRAIALKAGIGSARVADVFQHFKNHHVAKGSLFADWDAAWRTWCGNDKKFNAQPNGRRDAKPIGSFCDDLIASAEFAESGGSYRNGDMRPADSSGENENPAWLLPERQAAKS